MSIVECGCIITIPMPNGNTLKLFKMVDGKLSVKMVDLEGDYISDNMIERNAKELRDGLLEMYPIDGDFNER